MLLYGFIAVTDLYGSRLLNYLGYARETRFFLLLIIHKFVVSVCLGNAVFFIVALTGPSINLLQRFNT